MNETCENGSNCKHISNELFVINVRNRCRSCLHLIRKCRNCIQIKLCANNQRAIGIIYSPQRKFHTILIKYLIEYKILTSDINIMYIQLRLNLIKHRETILTKGMLESIPSDSVELGICTALPSIDDKATRPSFQAFLSKIQFKVSTYYIFRARSSPGLVIFNLSYTIHLLLSPRLRTSARFQADLATQIINNILKAQI